MRHIGLEADVRPVYLLQCIEHRFPAVHAAPADFSFCRKAFAVVRSHVTCAAESFGNQLGTGYGVLRPLFYACCRVDTDYIGCTYPLVPQFSTYLCRLLYRCDEFITVFGGAHGRPTVGWPDGSD